MAAATSRALGRRRQPPHGWLVIDDAGVHRVDRAGKATLVLWSEPFGLTVLASADRATLLLALTSPRATRYLPATVRDAEDASAAPGLLERATTAAASDLRAADESALSAADAERLLSEITPPLPVVGRPRVPVGRDRPAGASSTAPSSVSARVASI